MKCIECNHKFKTKGVRRCANAERNVCDRCAQIVEGHHRCDLRCPRAKMPRINWYPATSGWMGSESGLVKTTIEEFLPRGFHFMDCTVHEVSIALLKPSLLRFNTRFTLHGNTTLGEDLYVAETWKLRAMEDAYKDSNAAQYEPTTPAPVFGLFLSGGAMVKDETMELRIGDEPAQTIPNNLVDLIAMPDSFPPQRLSGKPLANYSYISGKATVFYAPVKLGKTYNLSFDIECRSNAILPGLLYPYRFVDIQRLQLRNEGSFAINKPIYRIVEPIRQMTYPLKQVHNWNKDWAPMPMQPMLSAGDPLRVWPLHGKAQEAVSVQDNVVEQLRVDNYGAVQIGFNFAPPHKSGVYVDTTITTRPLPVRIYQQLQQLPHYRDFLISFELSNYSDKQVELEISSEILGFTDPAITTVQLEAYKEIGPESTDRKWWQIVSQCPRLQFGVLERVAKAQEATLKYEVVKVDNGERTLLKRGTETVRLLPRDTIVWSLNDQRSGMQYDLASMLGAWVSPTDVEGELDRVRGAAKKYHPQGVLAGMQSDTTIEEQTRQVQALFEYLGTDEGIRYVNHAFAFDYNQGGQRVLTPESVLRTKSGNCIDLTVLMASLLEGLGFNPLIMLMPGHAFLGWGNPRNGSEMDVLECTAIGGNFNAAQVYARRNFRKHFFFTGWDDKNPAPNHLLMMSDKKSQIVDMSVVRSGGVNRQAA